MSLGFLNPFRRYLAAAGIIAVLAWAAWTWRLDALRAQHLRDWRSVSAEYSSFRTQIVDRTAEALTLDRARNARVAAQQVAIIKGEEHAHLKSRDTELARLRERLRTAPRADPGGGADTRGAALPILSTGPMRPGEAAIVDVADAETCTVNTLKLESLIIAWGGVAAIDPNDPAPTSATLK